MSDEVAVLQALDLVSYELRDMRGLLKRAREELRMIRMKDSAAVYDSTLRIELDMLLVNHIEPDSMKARDEAIEACRVTKYDTGQTVHNG